MKFCYLFYLCINVLIFLYVIIIVIIIFFVVDKIGKKVLYIK